MHQIIYGTIIIAACLISCNHSDSNLKTESSNKDTVIQKELNQTDSIAYRYEITENEVGEFGYQLFQNDILFINQPMIPAISGNKGFSTKEKAIKTAEFAIHKMNLGFIPPTITQAELDSLDVLD